MQMFRKWTPPLERSTMGTVAIGGLLNTDLTYYNVVILPHQRILENLQWH